MKYEDVIARCNPSQSHWEVNQLLVLLDGLFPRNILEIGVHRGGSLRVWDYVFQPKIIVGIDSQIHPDAREGYRDDQLIEGLSQSDEVVAKVKQRLGDEKLDFVFIDGGHRYEEVSKDFSLYSTLVKPGGVVAFHDVMIENDALQCNVARFWNDLKPHHKTVTIWDGTKTGTGEGIVFL